MNYLLSALKTRCSPIVFILTGAKKPYILLAAVGEQTTTNSPVVALFLASLKQCEEHPETLLHPSSYFTHLSTTVADEKAARSGWVYAKVYERAFGFSQYHTVVAMALARQRAAEKGLAPRSPIPANDFWHSASASSILGGV